MILGLDQLEAWGHVDNQVPLTEKTAPAAGAHELIVRT